MTITVNEGAKLTVDSNKTLTVSENATLTVAGTVAGSVTNNGSVNKAGNGNISGATIVNGSTGTIVNNSQENVNIEGIIKGGQNEYDADQIVTIVGDTSLDVDAVLKINGTLVVKEGVTLTLKAGSKLTLESNAVLDIQGTIVVEETEVAEKPTTIDVAKGTVNVNGTLDVNGVLKITTGTVTVEQDGVLNVLSTGTFNPGANKVFVKASGTMNVNGSLETSASDGNVTIENAGNVTFDSEVKSGNVIVDMKNGAVLDVKQIILAKDGTLEVKDGRSTVTLKATAAGLIEGTSATIGDNSKVNAVLSGVNIAETVTTAKNADENVYVMSVSGSVAVSPVYVPSGTESDPDNMAARASITLNGFATDAADKTKKSKLTLVEGLTVGENVTLVNSGTLEVTVTVDLTKGTFENNGTITVSDNGSIVTKKEIAKSTDFSGTPKINAARYDIAGTTASEKTYYYVTLDAALAAAASNTTKTITVLGAQTLTASADLVSGATLDVNGATVTIGSGDSAADVVLTVKSGATVKGTPASIEDKSTITVKGTVLAEKKTDLKDTVRTALTNGADVYTEDLDEKERPVRDGWAKWTNVATAMADPTVTIVKLTKELTLESDLTIPEGKTLDTNNQNVKAEKNVTIAVEGTLYINGSTVTLTTVNTTATTDKDASIIVKGLVQSNDEIDIKTAGFSIGSITILGAYYHLENKYCLTTVEKAAPLLSSVDDQTITINGKATDKLSVSGDISFSGKSATEPGTVEVKNIKGVAFSGSVAIDNATVKFPVGIEVSGTFSNASGSVAIVGMTVAETTVASATADGTAVLTFSGKLVNISEEKKQAFAVTGEVTVDTIDLASAVVNGKMTVKNTANAVKDLTINAGGEVIVAKNAALTSGKEIVVLGLLDASADRASVNAKFVLVGTNGDGYTGAAAVVNGSVTFTDYSIVVPGSTIPEKFGGAEATSTEYYVGNAVYVTVYVPTPNEAYTVNKIKASEENAEFKGWYDAENVLADTKKIGDDIDKVYAQFDYNIYIVTVVLGAGIENVAIDDNLVSMDSNFNYIVKDLKAGTHKVTYTLSNGYSGTATLTVNGEKQSGMTFTASGTDYNYPADAPTDVKKYVNYTLQLSGVTASGYAPAPTPAPSTSDDDGLSITDYLLIVLVILIVIMAVIVAMRLMRS